MILYVCPRADLYLNLYNLAVPVVGSAQKPKSCTTQYAPCVLACSNPYHPPELELS